jgi:glycosyltransferase involved in cell wall biosynthesis
MSNPDLVSNQRSYPLVTIAIPTFNRASLLKDCITSALSQTYRHLEVLVSDNASTDETEEILSEFSDGRLRIIRQETNIGPLPNFNACLADARGDYVIFVGDDDKISPWLVERCVDAIKDHPQIPIVVALSDFHSPSTGTRRARTSRHLQTGICDGTDILLEYLKGEIAVLATCSVMLRTEALRAEGGIPLDFPHTSDIASWAPHLFAGKAGFVNEACATWHSHEESETGRMSIEQLLCDGWKVADLISDLASQHTKDLRQRHMIQLLSRRCFAGRGFTVLSDYRRSGGGLQNIMNIIWQFRRDLANVDMKAVLKLIATILCPRPIADQVRRLGKL